MIFVTVGTQLPFDRLVRAVDGWAGRTGSEVFAQIGMGESVPAHASWARFLDLAEYKRRFQEADLIVSHAGIGSIFTAIDRKKPIVVMPRLVRYGEIENEHQLATARRLGDLVDVRIALDERSLVEQLDRAGEIAVCRPTRGAGARDLVCALREFFAS